MVLNRDERGLYFRGDMSILRGSYKVFGNKFQITDGTFDFSASETSGRRCRSTRTRRTAGAGLRQHLPLLSWPYDKKEPRIKL